MGLKIGDAGYRIIEPIASGGMGEVYKAEHIITKRIEAIKVLSGAGTEEQTDRFLREIQLQASLSHPNIAAVYNAFRFEDDLVMVMELVEGEPLRELLARGPLPLPLAAGYARQVLDAMSYAHEHGVIHRDITPSNIVVTPQGTVKLMDFGLAKTAEPSSASQSGAYMGSPHYMSPEQVKDAMRATARSDIYSLGAVLYEMATGAKVFGFAGDSPFTIMQAQVETAPVPPVELNAAIPAALNAAILTALEKDPERRFPDAGAFRQALEEPDQAVVQAAQPVKKSHRALLASAFQFTAAGAIILLPLAFYQGSRNRPRELRIAPPAVQVRPANPPLAERIPEVSAAPVAPADAPNVRPARKRVVKRASKRDPAPAVMDDQQAPAASEKVEPARTSVAPAPAAPARTARPAPESVAAAHLPEPDPPVAAIPPQPESAPEEPTAAASKEKKPHGRIRRTLGKIFRPFH